MIPTETLPDALAADLRDAFLLSAPIPGFPADAVRLDQETADVPARRILVKCGEPRRQSGMDLTARIPFTIDYIAPMDEQTPGDHREAAGKIDSWIRSIKLSKRRALLDRRVYLHDLYTLQPTAARPTAEREGTSTIRGEAVVTLAEVELD